MELTVEKSHPDDPEPDERRRSARQLGGPEVPSYEGVVQPFVVTRTYVLEMKEKYGIKNMINRVMEPHITPWARAIAAKAFLVLVLELNEGVEEMVTRIWDDFITEERLWDKFGGVEAFKKQMDYGVAIAPVKERYRETDKRKASARKKIKDCWGYTWEDDFDPHEFRLRSLPEHFLRQLAALAKSGWSMALVWKALNASNRLRLDGPNGSRTDTRFMVRDLDRATEWLEKAALEAGGIMKMVNEENLAMVFSNELRPRQKTFPIRKPRTLHVRPSLPCQAKEPRASRD